MSHYARPLLFFSVPTSVLSLLWALLPLWLDFVQQLWVPGRGQAGALSQWLEVVENLVGLEQCKPGSPTTWEPEVPGYNFQLGHITYPFRNVK